MTTVVYDGTTLATDSQVSSGGDILPVTLDKISVPEENETWWCNGHRVLAFGLAGAPSVKRNIINMLRDNVTNTVNLREYVNLENSPGATSVILVLENGLSKSLTFHIKDSQVKRFVIENPSNVDAVGSGEPFAYAAMSIGLDAVAAVEMAIKNDSGSGGEIKTWTHPGVPKKLSVYKPKKEKKEAKK